MSLLGMDLNATRARAVRGPLGEYPCTEPLDAPRADLPLVMCLQGRAPVVGVAGLRLCRKSPHLAWRNFLPQLGEGVPPGQRQAGSRRQLDAAGALDLVFRQAAKGCRRLAGVVLALPAHLAAAQIEMVQTAAEQAGLPLLGSITTPLAAALAAHAEQGWNGSAVVVDVDDQAMTVATVGSDHGQAELLDVRCVPQLNRRLWQDRLLNAVADCCILESRWDPRESALADQSLFDQLDGLLDSARYGRTIQLKIEAPGRHHHLVLQPRDPAAFCSGLCRQTIAEVDSIFAAPWPDGAPSTILLTADAARMPGLAAALQTSLPQWTPPNIGRPKTPLSQLEDFGTALFDGLGGDPAAVVVLTDGAAARGAHAAAAWFQRGDIALGHLHSTAPLPLPLPAEAGPARLHFQGQDYVLGTGRFTIGRQPGDDLVFDSDQWPGVAIRHCEIVYDHRAHMLCDHSRGGTLLNDRPAAHAVALHAGDWIRLGQDGPLLRFLGQSAEIRTTA
jgi:FHA domain